MSFENHPSDSGSPSRFAACATIVRAIVALTSLAGATVVLLGADSFRLPKELVIRAGAILLLVVLGIRFVLHPVPLRRQRSAPVILALAAVGWAIVTTLFASNRAVSIDSLIDVIAAAVVFLAAWAFARELPAAAALVIIVPALINAGVLFLQAAQIWNPFEFTAETPQALRLIALLGNPDDVGMYMTPVAVCAAALALAARSWLVRLAWGLAAAIAIAALLLSHSLAALGALGAGMLLLFLLMFRGKRALVAVAVLLVAGAAVMALPLARRKLESIVPRDGATLAEVSRGRFHAFYAAALMFRDAPLLGVGPGGFAWAYFDYKLKVDERRPALRGASQENFGETHNDHLQLLAEGGLPGYLIFLAALAVFASASFHRPPEPAELRRRFAHLVALPLAGALFVLALAQFPLHIPAPRLAFLLTAALSFAWRVPHDADGA